MTSLDSEKRDILCIVMERCLEIIRELHFSLIVLEKKALGMIKWYLLFRIITKIASRGKIGDNFKLD